MSDPVYEDEFDDELKQEFRSEFQEAYTQMQEMLLDLESSPGSKEDLNALFRVMHSMKSNIRMVQFNEISDFVHALEEVLDDIRNGVIKFSELYSDLFLLGIDKVIRACDMSFSGNTESYRELLVVQQMLHALHADKTYSNAQLESVLSAMDPSYAGNSAADDQGKDLDYFKSISMQTEGRIFTESGAINRVLDFVLHMNEIGGGKIDATQLTAAVYIHDLGMAFFPLALIHKDSDLSADEKILISEHPRTGANLLSAMPNWKQAATIVHQHHEWFDGNGYANGLSGDGIHDGARILAIADAFETMTHNRSYRDRKRPILRAVAEINAESGKQFDPMWVEIFNVRVRKQYVSKK